MRKILLGIIVLSIVSITIFAAENPTVYFNKYDNSSQVVLDYSIYVKFLSTYLDYMSNIKVTSLNRNEQMAYWINLYNALTIKVIPDNYPLDSIRKISSGLFSPGPWKLKLITVGRIF